MNQTNNPVNPSNVPWPTSVPPMPVPDTSMLPGSDKKAAPPAVGMLDHAAQGAHDTIDRMADSAAPAVQRVAESVSSTGAALHAGTDRLRARGDAWVEGVRTTVRSRPLVTVAAALALGAVIARLARIVR